MGESDKATEALKMPTISIYYRSLAKQAEEERLAEEALEAEYKKQKKQERSKDLRKHREYS